MCKKSTDTSLLGCPPQYSAGFRSYRAMPNSELIAGEWLEDFSDYVDGIQLISDMVATSMLEDETPCLDRCQQITMLRFLRSTASLISDDISETINFYIQSNARKAEKKGGK